MEIMETIKTTVKTFVIHYTYRGTDEVGETHVDVHYNEKGEVILVQIGRKEITAFDLNIIEFLIKEGELY